MQTMVLTVAYDGAPFRGFARQEGLPTVQGALEEALALLYRREVATTCAGRTDAGVHALGQQVSFPLDEDELEARSFESLRRSLNALTPKEVAVRSVRVEPDGFSARFDAREREYRYRFVCSPVPPVFLDGKAWWVKADALDVQAMEEAARCLVGEHDFKAFCQAGSAEGKPTVREVYSLDFAAENHLGEDCLTMRIVGSGFLHNMVRNIAGSLVEVGLGRKDGAWLARVLASRDRTQAGQCAPACGLTFWEVRY